MLEWLLRKIFGIKKPSSREDEASQELAPDEAMDNPSGPALAKGSLTQRVNSITPRSGDPVSIPSVSIPADEVRSGAASAPAPQEDKPQGKVHIFNFRAWFYADPVKAALTLGLAFLSWLATYTGMLELIQANTGSLDMGARVAIGFAVMMLMLMILYLLDSLYAGGTPTWIKPVFVFGYLFLTLISVGFGFGFYWKYLEAQTEATRSAESAVSQVQVALQIGQSRLEQLQSTFAQLTTLSITKAAQERDHGNSCPNSKPGAGPRMRLRDSDSQKFGYAADYITGRATNVKTDLNALNGDLKKVVSRDKSTIGSDGTRNKFLRALGRKLDLTIARFNTLRTDPQLRQFRDSFDKRASTTQFPNGRGGTFRCPDVQLQTALRGVVRAIDDIPEIKNPRIAAVEGSEAIVEAFRRLAVTLAALPTFKLPPSPDELRKARKQAISAGRRVEVSNIDPGLSKRDYIPLSAAVFVDLCILLISLNRSYDHLQKIQTSVSKARASEFGGTMLDIFEAHKNKISEEMLEIFHHAEFEMGRDYYIAVPLVKGSKKAALTDELHATRKERNQSLQAKIDRKIEALEADLQKLERARAMQDSLHSWSTAHETQSKARQQLRLSHSELSPEVFASRPDVAVIDRELSRISNHLASQTTGIEEIATDLAKTTGKIQQIKSEIDLLSEQRNSNLADKEKHLENQIETTVEYDIAKEARFLSNLCISLEANGVLHLASIWPFQRQVRTQLKRHGSRYFAQDRHYRVYRFRKVADTQSQMVLDLIMEAVKRSEKNDELNDNAQLASRQAEAEQVDQQRFNSQTEQKIRTIEDENQKLKIELASQKAVPGQPVSPIDHDAVDAEIMNSLRRPLSQDQQRQMNSVFSNMTDSKGLGVPDAKLADLVDGAADREQLSSKVEKKSPRSMRKMLGGIFSGAGKSASEGSGADKIEMAKVVADKIEEPAIEAKQDNSQSFEDRRDRVNMGIEEDRAELQERTKREPRSQQPQKDSDGSSVEEQGAEVSRPSSEAKDKLSARINGLKENMPAGESDPEPRAQKSQRAAREALETAARFEAAKGFAPSFTDPVLSDSANPINQDPADRSAAVQQASIRPVSTDEPSEADKFQEGRLPGFLRGDDALDEVSEEMGTQSIAKRFSPTTKEK